MGQNQHIVKRGEKWGVLGEGNARVSSLHNKQSTACNVARTIAKKERAEVVIHGRDGKIRDKDSYGKDSCPPRDKKF